MDSQPRIEEADSRDIGDALLLIGSLVGIFLGAGWIERGIAGLVAVLVVFQRRSRTALEARLENVSRSVNEVSSGLEGLGEAVSEQWQAVRKEIDSLRHEIRGLAIPVPLQSRPVTVEATDRPRYSSARFGWRIATPLVLFFATLNFVVFRAVESKVQASEERFESMQAQLKAVSSLSEQLNDQISTELARTVALACQTHATKDVQIYPTSEMNPADSSDGTRQALSNDGSPIDLSEARAQLMR